MFRKLQLARGFSAVFYKEVLHMRRDSMAMMVAMIVPLMQMTILGAAIDTNVRQVATVVYDQSGEWTGEGSESPRAGSSAESRAFIDRFKNSDTFKIVKYVHSDAELTRELVAGRARVGVKIPYDFDRNLLRNRSAQVLVLVDGSESSVAGQAVTVAANIGLEESIRRRVGASQSLAGSGMRNSGNRELPLIDVRPKVMFNPDSRSPNFFLPGLIAVLMLMATTMLSAFSIVREKEKGTLEQLIVTPVRPLGLMLGKIMPYFLMALIELTILLAFMRFVFRVPIHGNVLLLFALTSIYLFVNLALGLMISVRAQSQVEALQSSMALVLPSIFLSGYVFPRDTMPTVFYVISHFVPATYMITIFRGIILRGAQFMDLWMDAAALAVMGVLFLFLAANRFKRMIV